MQSVLWSKKNPDHSHWYNTSKLTSDAFELIVEKNTCRIYIYIYFETQIQTKYNWNTFSKTLQIQDGSEANSLIKIRHIYNLI